MLQVSAPDFSLADTLACGQTFRWRPSTYSVCSGRGERAKRGEPHARHGAHYGFIKSCAVRVRHIDSTLTVETVDSRLTAADVIRYFALDLDLAPILASIDADAQIHDAITRHRGLRILRQDPWECLASFICSSFNNIARIEGMIERLCQHFGSPLAFNGFRGCSFPAPEAIARAPERRLRELGLGFRAPYLRATAKMIAEGKLPFEALRRTDYVVTKAALLRCDGVGDKVADCVALFGLEKYEAFPVDVWIERAMRYYFRAKTPTPARAHDFARRHFGRYAGWAQQYLYHYVRMVRRPAAQPETAQAGRA